MGNREGDLIEFTFGPIPELQCSNATNFTLNSSGPCCLINHTASSLSFLLPTILASGFRSSGKYLLARPVSCTEDDLSPLLFSVFSGYIVQIVDDAQRGLLWVLSSNSNLAVYQYHMVGVKTAPNYLSKLASLSGSEFMSRAASAVRSIDRNNFLQWVNDHNAVEGRCLSCACASNDNSRGCVIPMHGNVYAFSSSTEYIGFIQTDLV